MTYDDLRTATGNAMRDERLRQAALGRHARRLRAEARARLREERRGRRA
ncbi:hypothetical protein [Nocardiopsis nanhaiensis]